MCVCVCVCVIHSASLINKLLVNRTPTLLTGFEPVTLSLRRELPRNHEATQRITKKEKLSLTRRTLTTVKGPRIPSRPQRPATRPQRPATTRPQRPATTTRPQRPATTFHGRSCTSACCSRRSKSCCKTIKCTSICLSPEGHKFSYISSRTTNRREHSSMGYTHLEPRSRTAR